MKVFFVVVRSLDWFKLLQDMDSRVLETEKCPNCKIIRLPKITHYKSFISLNKVT
jgi:hypothetical protein